MANLYNVPLQNSVQLALQNALNTGDTTTMTFTTNVTTKLQASSTMKGILIIDRIDSSGTETPTKVEIISFTGVTGSTVTGLTRGLAGTTDQDHAVGAVVEFMPDVTWAQAINDVFIEQHNADGTHKTLSNLSLASTTIQSSNIDSFSFKNINAPEGFLINGRINVTSGASLSLSLSLQTLNGSNPTTTNPIYVRIGDSVRTVSSPLNLNLPAGTNYFNSGASEHTGQEIDYFVYVGDANGDVRLGFGRIPFARRFEDFSTTNTDEKHISFTSLLTTSQNCVNIGRFPATLTGSARTWSIPTLTGTNLIGYPVYETRELTWSPQYTGFSTAPSGVTAKYKLRDDFVRCMVYETANGTSNSTSKSISFPFRSRVSVGYGAIINTIDNGTQGYGKVLFTGGSNTPGVFPSLTVANWTASGNCRIETLGVTIEYGV